MVRKQILPVWIYPIPGIFLQLYGLFSGTLDLTLAGSALASIGLGAYARGKGYSAGWGLWGVAPIIGPALLVAQPDRRNVPNARMRGGVPLLSIMAVVGVAVTVIVPEAVTGGYFARVKLPPEPPAAAVKAVEVEAPPPPPPPEPEPAPAAPEPPAPPGPPKTFEEAYGRIELGMTYGQVRELAGDDMMVVGGSGNGMQIIRWESKDHAFIGRFLDGKLDMLSSLQKRVAPLSAAARQEMRARVQRRLEETAARVQVVRPEEEPVDEPAPPDGEVPLDADTGGAVEEPSALPESPPAPSGVVTGRGRQERVVRVGGEAGARKGRPSLKKARLPRYSGQISRGPHDVVFVNRGENVLRVAVRLNMRGIDFEIRPDEYHVIFVSNGSYSVSYIDTGEPETLHSIDPITVDTPPTAISVELPR